MTTGALRCVSCGRERPRNAPVCDACERRLREAAELSKLGVDVRKDHVTGHFQIKISRDASRESSEWFEQVCAIVRRFLPIRALERIREFASLGVLDLSQARISDDGLQHLACLALLSRLSLYGTRIRANGRTLAGPAEEQEAWCRPRWGRC